MDSGFRLWHVILLFAVVLFPVFGVAVRWTLRRVVTHWEVAVFSVFLTIALFLGLIYLGGWAMSPR
jgi:hypothetical protein